MKKLSLTFGVLGILFMLTAIGALFDSNITDESRINVMGAGIVCGCLCTLLFLKLHRYAEQEEIINHKN